MPRSCRWLYTLHLVAVALVLATAGPVRAGEDYFLLMFGSQRTPTNPNYTHTWATFVRASWPGDGPCPGNAVLEAFTISWLPVNGVVRVNALCPEPGRNFGPAETLEWCYGNAMRVSLWGPYRVHPELYVRAAKQKALLDSGKVRYKCFDAGYSSDDASNCIHAVSSIAEGYRLRVLSPGWGETASFFVLQKLERWVVEPGCTHPWVGTALGLDLNPIIYRDWGNPRSGGIRGPVNRLLGGENDLRATFGPPVR